MTHRRWTIGVLLAAGVLVNYIDRISLSVAAPQLQHDFGLSPQAVGFLFSAFFWSYSLAQLPGGLLLDRFGIKTVGRWGTFLWSAASGATALCSGYAGIFAARLLLGIAEAPGMIGNQKATGLWFPTNERSRSTAIFDSAAKFANVIGVPIVAFFVVGFGWRWGFAHHRHAQLRLFRRLLVHVSRSLPRTGISAGRNMPISWPAARCRKASRRYRAGQHAGLCAAATGKSGRT